MAKLTESYLRNLIKSVMRENMGSEDPEEYAEQIRQQRKMDKKHKASAFDDKYFGEGKPWEEAVMNLESVMTDYEMGSMTAEELTQAADDLAALIASAPKSRKAKLSKLVADAHNLSSQEPMYESRKSKRR
jgi:hypothetical protein